MLKKFRAFCEIRDDKKKFLEEKRNIFTDKWILNFG
jgi:hypothetical protein